MQSLLFVALVLAQAKSTGPLDVSAYKDKLKGLTDGQGHYILYNPEGPYSNPIFYGDGKTFHQFVVFGGGASGTESWSVNFWDPRILRSVNGAPEVRMKDSGGSYEVTCGEKMTAFKSLKGEELKKLTAGTFLPRVWTRQPERLLRDDAGNYFFVDRLRTESRADRRDFRVYMGPRSKMKLLPLKDIVDDSKGTIFATANGNLRLVSTDSKPLWIAGKEKVELTDIPVDDNARMIYLDLGPYTGQPLGTPCDDLQ
jgi:hypothetical protein